MNVLVISSSLRNGSNSEALADEFAKGSEEAGNNTEKISLKDKKLAFCTGCFSCLKTGRCCIKDDAFNIVGKMHDADALVLASPIYYYGVSGQLKTLLDRANPLYDTDYRFKSIFLLLSAAENEEDTPDKAIRCIQGWADCFERAHLEKTIFAGGVNERNEIAGHSALRKAYEAGKALGDGK